MTVLSWCWLVEVFTKWKWGKGMKGRRMEEWKYHHRHQIDFSKDKKENKKVYGSPMLLILSYLAGYHSGSAGLDHGLLGPRVDYLGRVAFYDSLESEQPKNKILGIFNGISKIWMDLERWTKQKTRKVRIESTFCDLRVDLLAFTNLNNKKCIVRTFMTAFSPIISPYGKAHHFSPSEWKFKLKIYMKSVK